MKLLLMCVGLVSIVLAMALGLYIFLLYDKSLGGFLIAGSAIILYRGAADCL